MLKTTALARALLLAGLLAGCTDSTSSGDTSLEYDGSDGGTHEKTSNCDDDGQVTITSNVNEGEFTVGVLDGDNKRIYDDTFDSPLDGESDGLEGASGDWTLRVDRSDDFDGTYTVHLGC